MLGIIGKPPLPIEDAMKAFYPLCTQGCVKKGMSPGHLDGWGVSGFSDGRAVYFARQAEPASKVEDEYQQAGDRAINSRAPIVIGHFRKASGSDPGISNTHPFHHSDWVFAHNGTIYGAEASFPLFDAEPLGQTDSERFFLWLWEQVHVETDPTAALVALLKKSREQLVFTSLNFLMSDGQHLWAYRDFGEKRLDIGETVKDREKYYTLFISMLGSTAFACSEPLPTLSKSWQPIAQRTLAVFSLKAPAPQLITL
jgi:predicted glutamine amidotransferase